MWNNLVIFHLFTLSFEYGLQHVIDYSSIRTSGHPSMIT